MNLQFDLAEVIDYSRADGVSEHVDGRTESREKKNLMSDVVYLVCDLSSSQSTERMMETDSLGRPTVSRTITCVRDAGAGLVGWPTDTLR